MSSCGDVCLSPGRSANKAKGRYSSRKGSPALPAVRLGQDVDVGKDLQAVAEAAGRLADERARKANPVLVNGVFWYGAVDIDPAHLVVWVMLNGPQEDLPCWFFPSGRREADEASACGLLDELYDLAGLVRRTFEETGWPRSDVRVGFESDERARGQGGWQYFK